MESTEAKKWLQSVIRQRKALVKMNRSHRNALLMINTCQRLTNLLNAFPYHGSSIFGFIRRHYTDILIIIPANQAEKHNCEILNQLALCDETKKRITSECAKSTKQPLYTQLQHSL